MLRNPVGKFPKTGGPQHKHQNTIILLTGNPNKLPLMFENLAVDMYFTDFKPQEKYHTLGTSGENSTIAPFALQFGSHILPPN